MWADEKLIFKKINFKKNLERNFNQKSKKIKKIITRIEANDLNRRSLRKRN
jgi:hypothetical protein